MKIGLLGLIWSDWSDVSYEKLHFAVELDFHRAGAHLTVPASTITDERAAHVREVFDAQKLPLMQLWGPYPSLITPDHDRRRAGIEGARDLVRLAARMGVSESGVRPTSMSPRGDWAPDPRNYASDTEDRLVASLSEILDTAEQHGIDIVLECHVTTTLRSPEVIRRVIERTGSSRLKINLDLCNFVGDLPTAFDPVPMIHHAFDVLGPFTSTVHVKDFYLEDRFVVHIAETVIGTGMMPFEPILERAHQLSPDMTVVIEHLPVGLIALAKTNLTAIIQRMGIPLG